MSLLFKKTIQKTSTPLQKTFVTGVTLLETIIVVMIALIMAAIALPIYYRTKEKSFTKEAIANLKLIAAAENIYRLETAVSYYPNAGVVNVLGSINDNLKLSIASREWDYAITGGVNTFTATAARKGAGGYLDCQYSMPNNDADGNPNPNGSCPP